MTAPFFSRFTPSLMDAKTLEAIFVQREALAQRIVDSIRESACTPAKHHTLLIGPRGIGKTHLVSLVYHRVVRLAELEGRLAVAWLREEEWGVHSFADLLLRILRAIGEHENDTVLVRNVDAVHDGAQKSIEQRATAMLEQRLGGRTMLLIAENLDDLFEGLDDEGQRRLRAYLQEQESWTILATSQSLFNGISLQTSPFYGFFRVAHLEQLSLDDAVLLLRNIATAAGNDGLAALLTTPLGRARVRAIHHLAGGSPRVYVILSHFLTTASLDQLGQLFLQAMDQLTPYYQARMQWLAPQQRRIIEILVEARGAVQVKAIAKRGFASQQTVSSQLKKLSQLGYVQSEMIGRESYYELREPLMRLVLGLKRQRGEPMKLIVEFLQLWYSRKELAERVDGLDGLDGLHYLRAALDSMPADSDDPRVKACVRDFERHRSCNWDQALKAAEELTAVRGSESDWTARLGALSALSKWRDLVAAGEEAVLLYPRSAQLWLALGRAHGSLSDHERALEAVDRAIEINVKFQSAWAQRAFALGMLNRGSEALAAAQTAVELAPTDSDARVTRTQALMLVGRMEDAVKEANLMVELDSGNRPSVEFFRVQVLALAGHHKEAATALQHLKKTNDLEWYVASSIELRLGNFTGAIDAYGHISGDNTVDPDARVRLEVRLLIASMSADPRVITALLRDSLKRGDADARFILTFAFLREVFRRFADDSEDTRDVMRAAIEMYRDAGELATLGLGVVASGARATAKTNAPAAIRRWSDAWSDNGREFGVDLSLSSKLLEAAAMYAESQDEKVLLKLSAEERNLMMLMLKDD